MALCVKQRPLASKSRHSLFFARSAVKDNACRARLDRKPTQCERDIELPLTDWESRGYEPQVKCWYYRARYYDPNNGRLLTEDPIRFRAGINFYSYVLNSPNNLADPQGLFPTSWHRERTQALALAVLGPKCKDKAKTIADADAGVDDFNHGIGYGFIGSIAGFAQFVVHAGEGWRSPGPHFPSAEMLASGHDQALRTCNLVSLGEYLHSMQDAYAHSGWTSFDHYAHGGVPDDNAVNGAVQDAAMLETVLSLRQFKSKCLHCCE